MYLDEIQTIFDKKINNLNFDILNMSYRLENKHIMISTRDEKIYKIVACINLNYIILYDMV